MNIKEEVIDYKYSRLLASYSFKSRVLDCIVIVPKGFVYDHESIPFIKGVGNRQFRATGCNRFGRGP